MNVRRAARELALKALFQEDVGHQPRDQVLDGVMGQVAGSVTAPVHQVSQEAQAQLARTAAELLAGLPRHAGRHTRQTATALANEVRTLEGRLAGIVRGELAEPPTVQPDDVEPGVEAALTAAALRLQRIGARSSPYPEHQRTLLAVAERRAVQMAEALRRFRPAALHTARLTRELVAGVYANQERIDARLNALATGWQLERQPAVDRNIMRVAACEILTMPRVPAASSITEAVELARKFSTEDSDRFVHGVLTSLAHGRETEPPEGDAAEPEGAAEPDGLIAIPDEPDEPAEDGDTRTGEEEPA